MKFLIENKNIALLFASIFLFIFILEIFFTKVLNKLPLKFHGLINPRLFALVQSSKNSVIPENYIALVGDSNAAGIGEFYEAQKNNTLDNPGFHSAHFIHQKTRLDVISFGAAGSGSLRGLVAEPINQYLYINSRLAFSLEQPKKILVYFYAGHDLDNNVKKVEYYFKDLYDINQIYHPEYFRNFIEEAIVKNHPLPNSGSVWSNFIFSEFMVGGIKNLYNQYTIEKDTVNNNFFDLKTHNRNLQWDWDLLSEYPLRTFSNIAVIDEKEILLSSRTQTPSIEMSPEQIKLGFYVFEQSLQYLSEFFNKSEVIVIHIPSPLSVYKLVLPKGPLLLQKILSQEGKYETRLKKIQNVGNATCLEIERITNKQNIKFLDITHAFKNAGKMKIIHGRLDFNHLSKSGYELLSDSIIQSFFNGDSIQLGCYSS